MMMRSSTLALFVCSLCAGMVLLFMVRSGFSRGDLEGYAVLSLDEGVPDRAAAVALERGLGRPVIAESSQWVFLHNFGSLERIPLGDYEGRLEVFDPRRDGYAQKLRDFFVRDGRRRMFIPLDRKLFGSRFPLNPRRVLEARIAAALGAAPAVVSPASGGAEPGGAAFAGAGVKLHAGVNENAGAGVLPVGFSPAPEFSLEMRRQGRPLGLRALLFVLAWGLSLIPGGKHFPAGSRGGDGLGRPLLVLLFPLMFPLGLWGGPGLALLAVFLLLGSLLREPLRELWVRAGAAGKGPRRPSLLGAGTYRFRMGYGLLLSPLLIVIPWLGGIPAWYALLSLAGLGGMYCLRAGIETRRRSPLFPAGSAPEDRGGSGGLTRRFVPLPILSSRGSAGTLAAPLPMLIFAAVSCLAFAADFLAPGLPGRAGPGAAGRAGIAGAAITAGGSGAAGIAGIAKTEGPEESGLTWPSLVREEDYRAHVSFQTGFSRRALHSPGAVPPSSPGAPSPDDGYAHYTVGEDGLVVGTSSAAAGPAGLAGPWTALPVPPGPEIPPFPLADLSDFLAAWDSPEPSAGRRAAEGPLRGTRPAGLPAAGAGGPPGNLVIPLLVLLAAVPFIRGRGRGGWKKAPPMPING